MDEGVRVVAERCADLIGAMSGARLPDRRILAADERRDCPTRVLDRLRRVWTSALRRKLMGETGRSAFF
jgi:hypothetical protein